MDEAAKRFWDSKYDQGLPSLTKPDPFFVSAYDNYIEPGSLAVASPKEVVGDNLRLLKYTLSKP